MRILSDFGERLSELIFDKNLTTEQLSKAVGISAGSISQWRTGKQNISLSNALKLADYFSCSIEFLIGRTGDKLNYVPREYPPFYERLLQVMKERGKSRYRIVKETKLSDGNFYSWKRGGDPFLQSVIDLADYFGYTIDYFIGRER